MTNLSDFNVQIFKEEDWTYYAEVVNLPWCFTQGDNLFELDINLKEAIQSYILSIQKDIINFKFNFTNKDLINA
jgi:predicted RNase H-like HicB family nuclease